MSKNKFGVGVSEILEEYKKMNSDLYKNHFIQAQEKALQVCMRPTGINVFYDLAKKQTRDKTVILKTNT